MTRRQPPMPKSPYEMGMGRPLGWFAVAVVAPACLVVAVICAVKVARGVPTDERHLLIGVLLAAMFLVFAFLVYLQVGLYRPRLTAAQLTGTWSPGAPPPPTDAYGLQVSGVRPGGVAPGVVVPGHRRIEAWGLGAAACAALAGGYGAVIAGPVAWKVVWAVVAAFFVWTVVDLLRTWSRPRRLILTVDGIRAEQRFQSGGLAWDDIVATTWTLGRHSGMVVRITAAAPAGSWQGRARRSSTRPGAVELDIETQWLDLDPLLLGMAVELYWQVPAARAEMADGLVRRRLLDADFAFATAPPQMAEAYRRTYRPR